jgi:hypothetical protein
MDTCSDIKLYRNLQQLRLKVYRLTLCKLYSALLVTSFSDTQFSSVIPKLDFNARSVSSS